MIVERIEVRASDVLELLVFPQRVNVVRKFHRFLLFLFSHLLFSFPFLLASGGPKSFRF
jgi:hypothetical protein